jgi:hypothetical protein
MALGSLTLVDVGTLGGRKARTYDVVPSSGANYTAGGEPITAANVGLRRIINAICDGIATTSNGATAFGIKALYQADGSVKLTAHRTAAAVNSPFLEAAANTDLSTYTVRITFMGN